MPTLATGKTSPADMTSPKGFTLIELLIVLAILGILGGGVALSLPDTHAGAQRTSLETWQHEIERGILLAETRGDLLEWRLETTHSHTATATTARLWRRDAASPESRPTPLSPHPMPLADGLIIREILIDGRSVPTEQPIHLGDPLPLFELRISDARHDWLLRSRPDAQVDLLMQQP